MNLDQLKYVHFIGIGGIGMSALARYFNQTGCSVSGYDKTKTPLTSLLQKEGMLVYFEENTAQLPTALKNAKTQERLIVYTPAIPKNHVELKFFSDQNIPLYKRAEVLGFLSNKYPTIAVAGTHGKTSTTSLLASILLHSHFDFIGFIGGINENFKSNLIVKGKPQLMLTEADEYDRSFLKLNPKYAVITSLDPDHLDIYEDATKIKNEFIHFSSLVTDPSNLFVEEKIKPEFPTTALNSYGLTQSSDAHPKNLKENQSSFIFDYEDEAGQIENILLSLPGLHNLENCLGAIAVARKVGVKSNDIKAALKSYKGVKRRFEIHINQQNFVYIDDYAHHPREIEAVVTSIKSMFPGKKITGVFQPHLFSRTRDFAPGFASSLALLDEVILLEIYPAREEPLPGITSQWLLDQIDLSKKSLRSKAGVVESLWDQKPEVLLTIGAGDIDQLVEPIVKKFES